MSYNTTIGQLNPRTTQGRVVFAVQDVSGVDVERMLAPAGKVAIGAARYAVVLILRRRFGWSMERIGKLLNRDHTTIMAVVHQFEGRCPMLARCRMALEIAAKAEVLIFKEAGINTVCARLANNNDLGQAPNARTYGASATGLILNNRQMGA